ncbi:hypothetical protein [Rubellimicrobium sp. CFH 75288]|uniref:hypothetical protein n=1 Tax=Rubellimicrobium sp. CFH 75288 TaxID=2697034 RepID=UPI0014122826|nr:hypothetical protein [Rubellimicrobium sp. CFH 75288]NAZ35827.1 hypothetical protein [Rubellimicrobium sp. CFH 75288]
MIELVFVACLSASPEICERRSLLFVDISLVSCAMAAQPELVRWTETHPGWQVRRWTCRVATGEREI